ncbi:UbiA family prenyltransferase [Polynucleobacter sp. P1-05-14]|uniref:UbiA family prenyltransferase n=1 Tax=Polynucleobacter sp. P1-05-14 TaxID=1819732 RepID=UPI001C0D9151|nr:UbiA family prenyltransferase [Polynucleobacter sp. P1-05-14]MBU3548034.1 UbiA family prenyltransferase [Polynucleobacter sp. P1-05-14]
MTNNRISPQSTLPLVVDLDGTLIKTDLLFESANQFITRHPFRLATLLGWFIQGKSHLKAELAKNYSFDASSLPCNLNLVAWLSEQRRQGRKIILATASHKLLAEAVANHLGLFDEVLATEGEINLKANQKRDLLVSKYGDRGFDYIGNDDADFPVWRAANAAYVVSSSPAFINRVRAFSNLTQTFPSERPSIIGVLVKALRPHQWLKNILIFVPLLAAQYFGNLVSDIQALIAFGIFSLTASSVYALNDLVDVADDRHHHRKRYRPFAAGNLSLVTGWLLWPLLLVMSFGLTWLLLPPAFIAVLAVYLTLTLAYSLRLKQTAIIDVLTLAGLYTLRIIAGAAAISVPLSFWLLTFSMFIFLSLAFIKRFSELKSARHANLDGPLRGRGYEYQDIELVSTMGISSGYLAVLVLALYIQDGRTSELYHTPQFIWLACPILLFWISRAWLITHRGQMHDDPIVFAIKDKSSWILGLTLLGLFSLAK